MMASWMVLVTFFCVLSVLRLTNGQSCVSSRQCAANQCCRDPATNRVLVENLHGFLKIVQPGSSGHCVAGGAQPGEMCDSTCSCPAGYECYSRITGVCCAPRTCFTVEEAKADREFWRCRPPPVKRRKRLFLSLCPKLPSFEAAEGGAPQN